MEESNLHIICISIKKKFFESKSIRHTFTKDERKILYEEQNTCEICNKKLNLKGFHIDHIVP